MQRFFLLCFVSISVFGCGPNPDDDSADAGRTDASTTLGVDDYAGMWVKATTGADLVLENDCGAYWLLDFDYAYNRVSTTSATTLKFEHCGDASCSEVETSSRLLTFGDDSANEELSSDLTASTDCTIRRFTSTSMSLVDTSHGHLRWRAELTYIGDGCEPFIPQATQGDSCLAIAATSISRID